MGTSNMAKYDKIARFYQIGNAHQYKTAQDRTINVGSIPRFGVSMNATQKKRNLSIAYSSKVMAKMQKSANS